MFLLPNNKKINTQEVMEGLNTNNPETHYFLNLKTGKVKIIVEGITDKAEKELKAIYKDNDLVEIPQLPSRVKYNWMKEFTEILVKNEDEKMYEKLSIVLDGQGVFRRFKDILQNDEGGWIHGWYQWENDNLFEEMMAWFESLNVGIQEDVEYFDDCPICQAMKHGLTSESELKAAFQAAKDKGALVGGSWFEDEEDGDKK